jgi:hypothetical protein
MMLKTENKVAQPMLPLIVTGVLGGYIKGAIPFMIGTLLTFTLFVRNCPKKYPKEFVKSAGFIVHLYRRLQKKMSKEKAFELTRATMLTASISVMQGNFRVVETTRSIENLKKYQQETNRTGITKENTMKVIEDTETCYRFQVTKCVFDEFFAEMGAKELTSIMCSVDNAIFNSYLPNELIFERQKGGTITEGCEACSFCIKNVEKLNCNEY